MYKTNCWCVLLLLCSRSYTWMRRHTTPAYCCLTITHTLSLTMSTLQTMSVCLGGGAGELTDHPLAACGTSDPSWWRTLTTPPPPPLPTRPTVHLAPLPAACHSGWGAGQAGGGVTGEALPLPRRRRRRRPPRYPSSAFSPPPCETLVNRPLFIIVFSTSSSYSLLFSMHPPSFLLPPLHLLFLY